MSDTHVEGREPAEAARSAHGGRHPSPKEYVRIALILAVITAAEVAIYYIEGVQEFLVPLLFLFSFIKFALVVMWFMHLKFDNRLYARFFLMGLAGAVTLYLVVLMIFQVFAE
jgi:cytochrome c oxidase subunit IV